MNTIEKDKQYILQTYKRQNLAVSKGKGKYLYDTDGKKYLDFFAGISVCNLGHCHPKVVSAIKKQSGLLIHASNHYYAEPQVELVEKLVKLSFPGRVFLSNSGAEANECALKLVRKWGNTQSSRKTEVVTFSNSFHGRTLLTLAATGQEKFHKGFEPMPESFKYAEFNNLASLETVVTDKTAAIMLEPVQGEGGINIATQEFMNGVKKLCAEKNIILIFDEVQCGMGRTGKFFAYEQYGIVPDLVTLAKSLAGGLPLGATIVNEKYADVLGYGGHGSTFGGNPVACAAACAVVDALDIKMLDKVKANGKYLVSKLEKIKKKYSFVKEIRAIGLLVALELNISGGDIVAACLEKGLVINCTQDKILRFLPPFIIGKKDINEAVSILDEVLSRLSEK